MSTWGRGEGCFIIGFLLVTIFTLIGGVILTVFRKVPPCMIYKYNAETGRKECWNTNGNDLVGTGSDRIVNIIITGLFCIYLFMLGIIYYWVRHFEREFSGKESETSPSFGDKDLSTTTTLPSDLFPQNPKNEDKQTPATVVVDLPESQQPPPAYYEYVLNLGGDNVQEK